MFLVRNDPDSTYGHILKNLTKDETFVDVVVNSYVMVPREDFQLCCAATRLLCDIMCYVESEEIYQETVSSSLFELFSINLSLKSLT